MERQEVLRKSLWMETTRYHRRHSCDRKRHHQKVVLDEMKQSFRNKINLPIHSHKFIIIAIVIHIFIFFFIIAVFFVRRGRANLADLKSSPWSNSSNLQIPLKIFVGFALSALDPKRKPYDSPLWSTHLRHQEQHQDLPKPKKKLYILMAESKLREII